MPVFKWGGGGGVYHRMPNVKNRCQPRATFWQIMDLISSLELQLTLPSLALLSGIDCGKPGMRTHLHIT